MGTRPNVQAAFVLMPGPTLNAASVFALGPKGRAIVLIDDVMTSGATANAASRALMRGGAKRVDVLVFARVV
jgi:predicted amidophosphoribosyltransferase